MTVFDDIDAVMAERNSWFGLAPTIVQLHSNRPESGSTAAVTAVVPPLPQGAATPDEVVTDQDVDDYINTFTRYTRPRALLNREQWMRDDVLTRSPGTHCCSSMSRCSATTPRNTPCAP